MKKISTLAKVAVAFLIGGTAFTANAQTAITEGTAFKPASGEVYSFSPSMDGTLAVTVGSYYNYLWSQLQGLSFLYSSENHSESSIIVPSSDAEPSNNETIYYFRNIKKGQTYYLYQNEYDGNVNFTFDMMEAVEGEVITSISPSTVGLFNYVHNSEIQIATSAGVTSFGTVTLTYGNESVNLTPSEYGITTNGAPGSEFLQISPLGYNALPILINKAANSGATSFTLSVANLLAGGEPVVANESGVDGVTVENGTVSVTYNIQPAPQYLADDSTIPEKIYGSYEEGDPAGIITLTFDQEIASFGEVLLIMGQYQPEAQIDSYPLNKYTKVDGKNLVIDLTGEAHVASTSTVTLSVGSVIGKNGLNANFSSTGIQSDFMQFISYSNSAAPSDGNTDTDTPPTTNPDVTYMKEKATQLSETVTNTDPAVTLVWPETVSVVNADKISIPVLVDGNQVGALTSTYINLVPAGGGEPMAPLTRVETGESGTVMYLLLGAAELLQTPGEYTLQIPAGMVADASGAVNVAQTVTVTYVEGVEGVITPEAGTEFEQGEEVVITITYPGIVEQNYSEDAPIVVSDYNEYDESFNWEENVLYIEGNSIVLNLGTELKPGMYYLSLREGQVVVDGELNAPIYDYSFTVLGDDEDNNGEGDDNNGEGDSSAVTTIQVENADAAVYNLNGVKVADSLNGLAKGVYIVNGQKVLVK